jgi:hypothetical protein
LPNTVLILKFFTGWPKEPLVNKPRVQYLTFVMLTCGGFLLPIIISCIFYVLLIGTKKMKFINQVEQSQNNLDTERNGSQNDCLKRNSDMRVCESTVMTNLQSRSNFIALKMNNILSIEFEHLLRINLIISIPF